MHWKLLQREQFKKQQNLLIGYKIADKATKVSRSSSQKNSETVESEAKNTWFEIEKPGERLI